MRALLVVRPVGLAGDDVLQPVAVDVGQVDRVQLAEHQAVAILLRARCP